MEENADKQKSDTELILEAINASNEEALKLQQQEPYLPPAPTIIVRNTPTFQPVYQQYPEDDSFMQQQAAPAPKRRFLEGAGEALNAVMQAKHSMGNNAPLLISKPTKQRFGRRLI